MAHIQPPHFTGRARRAGRRPASSPDMTSMVGLGFLLVSFFLMAADFTKPAVMQLTMPMKPEREDIGTVCGGNHNAMTLLIDANDKLYYYPGLASVLSKADLRQTDFSAEGLRQVLLENKRNSNDVVFLIKPSNKSSYQALVNVLDEMNITDTKKYALVDLTAEDQRLLDCANQVNL
ncbi:ExbD/TolR family protein [Hymenobacter canadensis]|uniref:Biopolymer transporter ExbD n=1 Tax=Hymenobacter canadensis TaxID=2999067 RepID=A0ABY7LKC8_9BACT|nr:biopolymer transporter ExbD [Hymenobacter canadensis]WBA40894.1 biopolymer transporter ExbD [Hymenobacter canadensis]